MLLKFKNCLELRNISFTLLAGLFLAMSALPLSAEEKSKKVDLTEYVWEYPLAGFTVQNYQAGVESMFRVYERATGEHLRLKDSKKVGIKIYTNSGPGLATPKNLVRAVIGSLEARGIKREDMFILDLSEQFLRKSGYLPLDQATEASYDGVPVYALDTGDYYNSDWYYDSNLPSRERLAQAIANYRMSYEPDPDERKSFLAAPLILDADFWINLPMVADSRALGVSGALGNATIWNVSNNSRFFASPANAPVAAAEIAGIPELQEGWIFTIMTLERYQYMGGPRFNSMYTEQEPRLWMSANPVALDYLMWQRIQRLKKSQQFPVDETEAPLFEYARSIGMGDYKVEDLKLRRLGPHQQPQQ